MANSKKFSLSSIEIGMRDFPAKQPPARRRKAMPGQIQLPRDSYRNHFDLVEPQINAEGVHNWPFDAPCPVDVLFLTVDDQHKVRMNRHGYFEVPGRSALHGRKTTALTWRQERSASAIARVSRF